jgi:hypothetical protein
VQTPVAQAASRLRGTTSLRRTDDGNRVRWTLQSAARPSQQIYIGTPRPETTTATRVAAHGFGATVRVAPAPDRLNERHRTQHTPDFSPPAQVIRYIESWWRTRATRTSDRER